MRTRIAAGAAALVAVVSTLGFLLAANPLTSGAADHLDAPTVKTDGRIDITDIYAFHGRNKGRSVLVMDVNPLTTPADTPGLTFSDTALYQFRGRQRRRRGRELRLPAPLRRARPGRHAVDKENFNRDIPARDRQHWTTNVVETEVALGQTRAYGRATAKLLLPDILTYDTGNPATFVPGLNGRALADDVIDLELTVVSNGAITTDKVDANDKPFRTSFPYLAAPH